MNSSIKAVLMPPYLTTENANAVFEQLLNTGELLIDCSGINRCDSAGIAVLIAAKAAHLTKQQNMSFSNPPKQLYDLAAFFKVEKLLFN